MAMNNMAKISLITFEHPEISILLQLIPSGLGKIELYIIRVSLPLNLSLSGRPGVIQMHREKE